MTGADLKAARKAVKWTQKVAAHHLGVTQPYLSMVERGDRPVSEELVASVEKVYRLAPTARPLGDLVKHHSASFYQESLGELGYPGFRYLRSRKTMNPASLLLSALNEEDLDARVVEALPWLPFQFPEMSWDWLVRNAKLLDRQNRLAFVTLLAVEVAEQRHESFRAKSLWAQVQRLEHSRLAGEDTLCKASLSQSERKWLRSHRPQVASHWNLLTDLKSQDLVHVA